MYLKVGLYDFFSYEIPGILAIIETYFIYILFSKNAEVTILSQLKLHHYIILAIMAYFIGHLISIISRKYSRTIINYDKIRKEAFEKVKKEYSSYKLNFKSEHIAALCSIIQKENPEQMIFIQWYQAISLMMRNSHFAILIFSIFFAIYTASNYSLSIILMIIFNIFILFITLIHAKNLERHHCYLIYTTIVGREMKLEGGLVKRGKKNN